MIIDCYEVPNTLILNYCRVIKLIETGNNERLDFARKELHNRIFEIAGGDRSLYRREDRNFDKALKETVLELTEYMEN